jgi:hypothetical protein
MRRIRLPIPAFALLIPVAAGLGAGCDGSDDTTEVGPTEQSTRYTRELSASEAQAVGRPFGVAGKWTLTTGGAVYTLSSSRQGFGGSLQVSGNRMTFGPPTPPQPNQPGLSAARRKRIEALLEGQLAPCGRAVGSYRTSLQGNVLTFNRVKDACRARRVALSKPWQRM